jgi:hypothetical protein
VRVGYPLAVGRPGRVGVVLSVVSELEGLPSCGLYRADLVVFVVYVLSRIGYLFAVGRVVRVIVVGIVFGDVERPSPAGVDREDLAVGSVVARIGYLFAAGRPGGPKSYLSFLVSWKGFPLPRASIVQISRSPSEHV